MHVLKPKTAKEPKRLFFLVSALAHVFTKKMHHPKMIDVWSFVVSISRIVKFRNIDLKNLIKQIYVSHDILIFQYTVVFVLVLNSILNL